MRWRAGIKKFKKKSFLFYSGSSAKTVLGMCCPFWATTLGSPTFGRLKVSENNPTPPSRPISVAATPFGACTSLKISKNDVKSFKFAPEFQHLHVIFRIFQTCASAKGRCSNANWPGRGRRIIFTHFQTPKRRRSCRRRPKRTTHSEHSFC